MAREGNKGSTIYEVYKLQTKALLHPEQCWYVNRSPMISLANEQMATEML